MNPLKRYPVFGVRFKGFRRSQVKSLAWAVVALCEAGQGRLGAMGRALAARSGVQVQSGINRIWRLLANERVPWEVGWAAAMLSFWIPAGAVGWVSLDWSFWPGGLQVLAATLVLGRRGVPVWVQAFRTAEMERSQNAWEEAFGQILQMAQKIAGVRTARLMRPGVSTGGVAGETSGVAAGLHRADTGERDGLAGESASGAGPGPGASAGSVARPGVGLRCGSGWWASGLRGRRNPGGWRPT